MSTRATIVDPLEELKAFAAKYQRHGDAAKALGISGPFLTDMLKGFRLVSPKVLAQLGLQRAVVKTK